MAEIKRLWAFGDSFTYSFELREEHKYYEYKPEDGKTYVQWLADKYNLELVNLATPGWGNINILSDLLHHVKYFSDDDLIIVGSSDSGRVQSFEFNSGLDRFAQASYSYYIDEYDRNNSRKHIDSNFADSLVNYIVNCRQTLIHYHSCYELHMIHNVLNMCKGHKKVLWSIPQWGNYETISQHTEGVIEDMHWSWDGHKQFAKFLDEQLQTTDFFIDRYTIELFENYNFMQDPLLYERKIPKL